MTFSYTIKEMMKEIQSIHIKQPYLLSIYGFGSYIRREIAKDCDLLLVVDDRCPNLGLLHADLYKSFYELGTKLSILFDLTVLTEREHKAALFRELSKLVEISLNT